MRAVEFSEYGGPEVLREADVPEPQAGPGQVRIRVRASGVNPFDHKRRSGMMARGEPLAAPVVPGLEAAGVVDQVGDGVAGVRIGEEVFGLGSSTYAEYAVLRAWAPKPDGLSLEQAATLGVAGETAVRALGQLGLREGQTLLVHGAAGGVGQAAVQVGLADGLRVIATASERNHALLRELGAEPVDYGDGLADRVRALAPDGVDGVLDTAGSQLDDLLASVARPEQVVTIANYTAAGRGARFTGGGGDAAAALARVGELAAAGRLVVRIAASFPLEEAANAHRLSESRHSGGRIILTVS
jgi:NADPH:quinone reductase-like Zn-dependent oxidoreductase